MTALLPRISELRAVIDRAYWPRPILPESSREGAAFEETASSGFAFELAVLNEDLSTDDDRFRHTADTAAFIGTIVHAHVMGLGADRLFPIRIEDHDVGVRADRDRAFFREQVRKSSPQPSRLTRRSGSG